MFINISPLKKSKDFKLLYIGQSISLIGNMISYILVPFQIYQITKSNLLVGSVSLVQLFSVIVFGILGGAYADCLNRKKLMIISEWLMILILCIFVLNSLLTIPSTALIFVLVFLFQAISSFHRPAMTALIQKIVDPSDFKAVGSLRTLMYSIGTIVGPALGGLLITNVGFAGAYLANIFTFFISLLYLNKVADIPLEKSDEKPVHVMADIKAGFKFAVKKPEIMGSYIVDLVAMIFAFPVALFPAMSQNWGGANAAGLLYSGMAIGAFFISIFSGWTEKIAKHGRAVVVSAALWAFFILWLGFTHNLYVAVLLLVLAGAADAVSGIFRQTIWNHAIPNQMRGRLSGIEMISYMGGPLLGNARAGYIASIFTVNISLASGGIICLICVILTAILLPKFWQTTHHNTSHI